MIGKKIMFVFKDKEGKPAKTTARVLDRIMVKEEILQKGQGIGQVQYLGSISVSAYLCEVGHDITIVRPENILTIE